MTEPLVSILLPHLRNPSNDAALRVCLDCVVANTDINYELIVESVAERRDIYGVVNRMAEKARTDWIIPLNTDVFVSPGWITSLWELRDPETIVTPVLVECGAIPVNERNLERDFGRTPQTFARSDFELWTRLGGGWKDGWNVDAESWYFPSILNRNAFIGLGGFDTSIGGFPDPLDMDFWLLWELNGGKFKRAHSYVYHLQAYNEPERGKRG